MSRVHLICGLPGAGKTTHARRLAEVLPALRFSLDEWMLRLYALRYDEPSYAEKAEACKELIWSLAQQVMALDHDVVLDWNLWSRERRAVAHEGSVSGLPGAAALRQCAGGDCHRAGRASNGAGSRAFTCAQRSQSSTLAHHFRVTRGRTALARKWSPGGVPRCFAGCANSRGQPPRVDDLVPGEVQRVRPPDPAVWSR